MKLKKKQIQQLYIFTQQHFVDYYDVQTELVDHLANGIEATIESNPNISFEEALKQEFKKFGVMGFSEVVEQKTKALDKRYRKMVWKQVLGFFKLPKIIFTLCIIYVLYLLIQNVENKNIVIIPITISLFTLHIFHLYKNSKNINCRKNKTGKKWLFESTFLQMGGLIHFLNVGIYLPLLFQIESHWTPLFTLIFTVLLVTYCLAIYLSIYIVAPELKQIVLKEQPEYIL